MICFIGVFARITFFRWKGKHGNLALKMAWKVAPSICVVSP
jgi:hypothetical protein